METIQDLINITMKETKTNSSDIELSLILEKLNSERDIIVEEIKAYRGEGYFSKAVFHDLIPTQYKYGDLYTIEDEFGTNKDPINKISAVFVKYSEDQKERTKCDIRGLFEFEKDAKDLAISRNRSEPVACLEGKYLYVFPTLKNGEAIVPNGIKLRGLITLPKLEMETKLKFVWGGRVFESDIELLKKAIKPLLYELVDNYQAQSVAEQNYLIAKRDFRRKIGRIKEPLIRELPDEDIDFFSN